MTYLKEFFFHYYNILIYRRKEYTIVENEYIKVNKFLDSYYVKNKNVYIIFCNENCLNNVYNYTVFNKRINIYILRIKKFNSENIEYIFNLIKNIHNDINIKFIFIHGFINSKKILKLNYLFNDNYYHVCITPFIKKIENTFFNKNYFKQFLGDEILNSKFEDIKLENFHKNLYIIFTNNFFFLRDNDINNNNIKINYCNEDTYLCMSSLILAKYYISTNEFLKKKYYLN